MKKLITTAFTAIVLTACGTETISAPSDPCLDPIPGNYAVDSIEVYNNGHKMMCPTDRYWNPCTKTYIYDFCTFVEEN